MRYALTFSLSGELHAAVKSLEENNTPQDKSGVPQKECRGVMTHQVIILN